MAKTGNYYHQSAVQVTRAGVGTTYNTSLLHSHDLHANDIGGRSGERYSGKIEGIYVKLNTISGAGRITLRACYDQDGDWSFLPDTEAVISTALTAAGEGAVAYSFELPVITAVDFSQVFLFFKTDAGTVTVEESRILWSE
jgi:hypothetical protein